MSDSQRNPQSERRLFRRFSTILLVVFCVTLCIALFAQWSKKQIDDENDAWARAIAADPDDTPGRSEFCLAHSFPYLASPERTHRILSNYGRLRIGLSKADVVTLLGKPDCAERYCPKERVEYLGTSWEYYLEKPHSMSNENDDKYVFLSFDPKKRLTWATSHNVEGLPELGSPSRDVRQSGIQEP
jgi:hypothetical protein